VGISLHSKHIHTQFKSSDVIYNHSISWHINNAPATASATSDQRRLTTTNQRASVSLFRGFIGFVNMPWSWTWAHTQRDLACLNCRPIAQQDNGPRDYKKDGAETTANWSSCTVVNP